MHGVFCVRLTWTLKSKSINQRFRWSKTKRIISHVSESTCLFSMLQFIIFFFSSAPHRMPRCFCPSVSPFLSVHSYKKVFYILFFCSIISDCKTWRCEKSSVFKREMWRIISNENIKRWLMNLKRKIAHRTHDRLSTSLLRWLSVSSTCFCPCTLVRLDSALLCSVLLCSRTDIPIWPKRLVSVHLFHVLCVMFRIITLISILHFTLVFAL